MKISYSWLKDYIDCDLTPQQVAEAMTSIGIEVDSVEEIEEIPGGLEGVVVAEVVECEPHPNSDHLHVTKVDDGSGELQDVVCGAPNVAKGQKMLFARVGAVLPGGLRLKKSKLRGIDSYGMICADDELGIGSDHSGIKILPADAPVGMSAKQWLGIKTEAVIEYEITANRADVASHWGVARDLYAYLKLRGIPCELHFPDLSAFAEGEGESMPIDVQDITASPRYVGITMTGVKTGPSPDWMQKRLNSVGLRPIDNIVDISNYVLMEMGQPLHTFDADKVSGGKVIVRRAAAGEKIRTLDGVERELLPEDIVIADARGPMCIAGVFGGEDSGVSDKTENVFIEGAYFDPGSIRKTSKKHGLQTDASYRFERGCDPQMAILGAKRAALLIQELAGGCVKGKVRESYPQPIAKKEIDLDYNWVEEFIGKKIGHDTIEKILTFLQYDFLEKREGGAKIAAPTYMVDVQRPCDVVEEILRIYGYNNIDLPMHMKMSVNATPKPEPEAIRNGISNFLVSNGFNETMNNSLTKASAYDSLTTFPAERCVHIVNPLSSDLNVMRQTLLLSGLEVIAYNLNRQVTYMKIFEYGSVYQRLPETDGTTLKGYEEHPAYAMFISGTPDKTWREAPGKSSYFALKGYVELLLRRFGADIWQMNTAPAPSDIFSEGVVYSLPGHGPQLAVMGTVKPSLARKFDVRQPVFAAEINWNTLFELVRRDKVKFTELPRFPEVRRDLAILLDEEVDYASLRRAAFKSARNLLKDVTLFDVYRGDKIPSGKKQYALSFVLQDKDRTLTDTDTENAVNRIMTTFRKEFGAELR